MKTLRLFKVIGVQVDIDYSWFVIFVLVFVSLSAGYFPQAYPGNSTAAYWITGLFATLLFFASVLIHELSHAAMGNWLGEKVERITLFIFGGMAHLSGEPKNPDDEIKIAAVGPLSSIVLAIIFWVIAGIISFAPTLWVAVFQYLAIVNLVLGVFNLLPGFPLDGGRLFRAILWKRSGDLQRATARAADWGNSIAWGLMALGVLEIFAGSLDGLWLIFIGLFLRAAAAGGYQSTMVEAVLQHTRVSDIMTREPVTLTPETPVGDAIDNYFLRLGYGGFPVVEDGRVVGVLSLSNIRDCTLEERAHKSVKDLMRPLAPTMEISPDASAAEAMHRMNDAGSGRLVVIEQGKLTGLVTRTGLFRLVQLRTQLAGTQSAA